MDVDALCAAPGMCVLANPNAPTGMALPRAAIERILLSNPNRVVLVDEAYVDFGAETALPLLAAHDNLLIARTYSKSRSMAGARLGFAFGSEALIADLETIRFSTNPYNLNRLTLLLGEAAIADDAYYAQNCTRIAATRESAAARLAALGFMLTESKANFLFARHPAIPGEALYSALKARGVLVRHFNKPRIAEYVRITIGTPEQMEALYAAIEDILKGGAPCAKQP